MERVRSIGADGGSLTQSWRLGAQMSPSRKRRWEVARKGSTQAARMRLRSAEVTTEGGL
jgi:hypothetical protein